MENDLLPIYKLQITRLSYISPFKNPRSDGIFSTHDDPDRGPLPLRH
jgi:hypothetical protein